jgi:hypothetical protein
VLVHRDVHDAGLVGGEAAERPDVGRAFGEHDVARVAVDAGDEVQCHLRADGDDHVVRVGADTLQRHHLADLLAQRGHSLRGAVLQRHLALALHEVGDLGRQRAEGQGGEVGHAAGQRDDLGPARHREQGADLRCGHACRASGEALGRHRCCCRVDAGRSLRRGHGRLRHGGSSRDFLGSGDADRGLRPIECNREEGTSFSSS